MRPDAGVRAQISADTAIVDHSAGRQQSTRRVTVAERPVSGQSCLRDGQGGRSSGESRLDTLRYEWIYLGGNVKYPREKQLWLRIQLFTF